MDEINHTQEKPCCASFEERVRENPTRAIFAAFGVGLAIALVVRACQNDRKPKNQVKQMLEDIQERLHDLADPAMERLHEFAGQGSDVLKKSASHLEGIHKNLRSIGCRVKNLFN